MVAVAPKGSSPQCVFKARFSSLSIQTGVTWCRPIFTTRVNWVVMEEVLRNLRQHFDALEDGLGQFLVNEAIWIMFMNCCVWAAVHLDKD